MRLSVTELETVLLLSIALNVWLGCRVYHYYNRMFYFFELSQRMYACMEANKTCIQAWITNWARE